MKGKNGEWFADALQAKYSKNALNARKQKPKWNGKQEYCQSLIQHDIENLPDVVTNELHIPSKIKSASHLVS